MKSTSLFGLLVAMLVASAGPALAAPSPALVGQAAGTPPSGFGSPPSGEIPILYNDQHVYAKPDVLTKGRVLAALAKNGTIYVPLRSMFEQMGATVSYDPSTKIATISKPGAEIVVTVGKSEVIVNGESRPLDVPPMVYKGVVVVPIRVISEGMGAYVLWVPDRHIVVVRYVPPTPPPTEAPAPPVPEATVVPAPAKTPNPLTLGGYARSYYFTRQNATNNPGTQFNFTPGAKYNNSAVNQASWNSAIAVHGDWNFPGGGWHVGGTYLYANPLSGPCSVALNHAKNAPYPSPNCVQQVPPNTNPDDTLPGFALSTAYEAYLAYKAHGFNGAMGNILITTPWANPADTRLKPQAWEGGFLDYTAPSGWNVGGADMLAFEGRTSSTFSRTTLLTSYPAGSNGLPANIIVPGGNGIQTDGFIMARAGYVDPSGIGLSVNGWYYNVWDIANMSWFEGKYTFRGKLAPFIAMQGGWEQNSGQSYIGKIDSQVIGAQVGANVTKNFLVTVGYDQIPWKTDSIFLPTGVTCSNSNYQISAKATLAYFLPLNAGQCFTNPSGRTNIYYGGWASPYSDNTTSDPLYTTNFLQGQVDRRAPGSSWQAQVTFTSTNQKWIVIGADAWYDYGNALVPQNTKIWWLDGRYRFSHVGKGQYHGLVLRYRYGERYQSNTYCGAAATNCLPGSSIGSTYLGGIPMFKYNRAMIEYDF
jgi:Copper amine oxidase N-terminal domain